MVGFKFPVKSKNIAVSPSISLHWQVSEETSFDSLIIWGQAKFFTDIETKTRLWSGCLTMTLTYSLQMVLKILPNWFYFCQAN
ncbi:MAG: hypothetical protein Ct9H90mP5_00770 [Acidimicrobiaceae bacterium]|nr:MAG: hypothetical protein Ct9H90mP5_00770 [Acidimicrobiaceae bacterium]